MRITKVELRNFKRFTDLTIDGIPADTKLVLLIGSNGSGKSSVFDAFEFLNSGSKVEVDPRNGPQLKGHIRNFIYKLEPFKKRANEPSFIAVKTDSNKAYQVGDTKELFDESLPVQAFYGRTSFRQTARLLRKQSDESFNIELDSDRPQNFIDRDNRFENDIDRITGQILRELFRDNSTAEQIKAHYIGSINDAFERIFGGNPETRLVIFEILPPLEGKPAQINFRKGTSEIPYDYLSAGEKEVLNILMNLLVRRDYFTDTIYFFDEIDLHLNTKLQFNLLKEVTENWIPENCQFWTASHSLGFIDYARQYEKGVLIDFDDLDFDQPHTLFPQPKEELDVYDIAVPKETLATLMQGKNIVVCENKNDQYYNLLVVPNTIFVGVNNSTDVFLAVKRNPAYNSIRDRDFIADAEIGHLKKLYPNHHILHYYCFENYLYHPDNLIELGLEGFNYDIYRQAILNLKNKEVHYVLTSVKSARQRYEEFKNDDWLKKREEENIKSVVDDLTSNDFERFYKFFSMKGQHVKIEPFLGNIPQKKLVQTNWFRQQISHVLGL